MMYSKRVAVMSACLLVLAGPARATTVDEFCDLDPHHWAYPAVKALVEKYHVMEGYPGGCPEVQQRKAHPAPARKRPPGHKLKQGLQAAPAPAVEACAAAREQPVR